MQGTLHKGEMYSLSKKIYLDPSLISSPVGSIVDGGNVLLGGNTISGRAQPNQQQEKLKKQDQTGLDRSARSTLDFGANTVERYI